MSTTPSNTPKDISDTGPVPVWAISVWWTDFLRESTVGSMAQVLDFSSRLRAKRATESPTPVVRRLPVVSSSDELSELVTKELPTLLEDIFSKAENIDEITPETMTNFQTMLHMAAEIDAKAGRFGMSWVGIFPPFSDIFKKALKPPLKKLIPENEQLFQEASANLSHIFNNFIQNQLLSEYGEIVVKNKDTYKTPEDMEIKIESLKSRKRLWEGWLNWAILGNKRVSNFHKITPSIPREFEKVIILLFELFIEHYVERVWETEAALRHAPAEVAKTA